MKTTNRRTATEQWHHQNQRCECGHKQVIHDPDTGRCNIATCNCLDYTIAGTQPSAEQKES
jgi:hypothetical protein